MENEGDLPFEALMVRAILIMCTHPHECAFGHMWLIAVNEELFSIDGKLGCVNTGSVWHSDPVPAIRVMFTEELALVYLKGCHSITFTGRCMAKAKTLM